MSDEESTEFIFAGFWQTETLQKHQIFMGGQTLEILRGGRVGAAAAAAVGARGTHMGSRGTHMGSRGTHIYVGYTRGLRVVSGERLPRPRGETSVFQGESERGQGENECFSKGKPFRGENERFQGENEGFSRRPRTFPRGSRRVARGKDAFFKGTTDFSRGKRTFPARKVKTPRRTARSGVDIRARCGKDAPPRSFTATPIRFRRFMRAEGRGVQAREMPKPLLRRTPERFPARSLFVCSRWPGHPCG